MDLNGDGVHFTSIQNSNISIDVNNDRIKDKMAWAGNDDGVLVWDKDQNQQITDASEFGFQQLRPDAQTDLEGLQVLDTNHNGLLDAGDDKFAEFAVWQDANGNGVVDAGEFLTLQERGIASINLRSDGQMRDVGTLLEGSLTGETDATVMGNAAYTRTDGSTGVVADAMLAFAPGHANANDAARGAQAEPPSAAAGSNLRAAPEAANHAAAAATPAAAPANPDTTAGTQDTAERTTPLQPQSATDLSAAAVAQAASTVPEPDSRLVWPASPEVPVPLAPATHAAADLPTQAAQSAWDAMDTASVGAASAAELARQAALFNQFCSADVVDACEPLGFVLLVHTLPLIDLQVISQDDAYHQPQAA